MRERLPFNMRFAAFLRATERISPLHPLPRTRYSTLCVCHAIRQLSGGLCSYLNPFKSFYGSIVLDYTRGFYPIYAIPSSIHRQSVSINLVVAVMRAETLPETTVQPQENIIPCGNRQ
jgi:hypothetical protein